MAIQQRRPAPGLIVHSDRGSQYASDVNSDLKLIQFWRSQRFKTDTPPSPAHAGSSLVSSLV
jgi:hypothetical protein